MKRHALRPGLNTLTLSLLSSLTLLTACGGGGKDAPAAAAPAADTKPSEPVKAPDPTAKDFSSADEPYFVAETSVALRGEPTIYRLNILDGRGPITETKPLAATALANGTFESSTPFTGKWTVIQKFKRTLEDVTKKEQVEVVEDGVKVTKEVITKLGSQYKEQLLGSGTLVFIQQDGDANKLVEIDLSRNSALTPKPLSSIADACTITGSHLIKRDGSEAAVFVTTAGADKKCGAPDSDDAKDNLVRIVKTGTTAAEERTKQYTPLIDTKQVVSHIYQDGVLTGVLAQRGASATTQLEVLSPTLSEVLNTAPIKIGTVTQYVTSPDDTKLGVEWIAHAPAETGSGYLRLQQFDIRSDKYVNEMYRFSWNATEKAASTSLIDMPNEDKKLTPNVPSNKGVYDHRYVYFVDGDLVLYGPTTDPKKPFKPLTSLDELVGKIDTTRVHISHQTQDYLVVRAEGPSLDAAFGVPKDSALLSVKLFDNTGKAKEKQQTPIGLWQKVTKTNDIETRSAYLITKQRSAFDEFPGVPEGYSLKRIDLKIGQDLEEFIDGVNRINVLSPIWSTESINGQRNLVSAIVCPRTVTSKKGNCSTNGDVIKTVDFDKKGFGLVLGKFVNTPVRESDIRAGDVYHGINAFVNLTRNVNGLATYDDPVFFNSQLAVPNPDPAKITTSLPIVVTPKPLP